MILIDESLIIPQALTTFKVLKVEYQPHCESTWWLEYNEYGPIKCDEQVFDTIRSDEKLKTIKAQIDLDCWDDWLKMTEKKEK